MKLRVLAFSLCLLAVFGINAFAAELSLNNGSVSVTLPEEYITVTQDNVSEHAYHAALLGYNAKSLKSHMQDNGILLLALTGNNTRQIQLRVSEGGEDSYAAKIGDLSLLTDEALVSSATELVAQLSGTNVEECSIVENQNGIKAILISSTGENAVTYQYITVRNGDIYSLVGHDAKDSDGSFLTAVFDSLSVKKESTGFSVTDGSLILTAAIILLLICGGLFLIIRLIISFVHDFRNRENDVSDYIKIKRRKF